MSKAVKSQQKIDPNLAKKKDVINLPAFSIAQKKNLTLEDMVRLRKKTIRRNAPTGEDLKGIRKILISLKNEKISVQEFIGLIAPFTADNGEVLRTVTTADLANFRKLTTKIYETFTQDTSDVLINEQLQLSEYYKEQEEIYRNKIMRVIESILEMAPNFNFQEFYKNYVKYLQNLFPIPEALQAEPEEIENQKRQKLYHRLQWLRTEGERLNQENSKLQEKLNELKKQYRDEQIKAAEREDRIEVEKEKLEVVEAKKQDKLDELNQSIEKRIIIEEVNERYEQQKKCLERKPSKRTSPIVIKSSTGAIKKIRNKQTWNELAAIDIENEILQEGRQMEINKLSVRSVGKLSSPRRIKRKVFQVAEPHDERAQLAPLPKFKPEIPMVVSTSRAKLTKTRTQERPKGGPYHAGNFDHINKQKKKIN